VRVHFPRDCWKATTASINISSEWLRFNAKENLRALVDMVRNKDRKIRQQKYWDAVKHPKISFRLDTCNAYLWGKESWKNLVRSWKVNEMGSWPAFPGSSSTRLPRQSATKSPSFRFSPIASQHPDEPQDATNLAVFREETSFTLPASYLNCSLGCIITMDRAVEDRKSHPTAAIIGICNPKFNANPGSPQSALGRFIDGTSTLITLLRR